MKAHLKINISLHLEGESAVVDPRAAEAVKYDLSLQLSGEKQVEDKTKADWVLEALGNALRNTLNQLSIVPVSGTHKPDLAAAFGGDPEPVPRCLECKGPRIGELETHLPSCSKAAS